MREICSIPVSAPDSPSHSLGEMLANNVMLYILTFLGSIQFSPDLPHNRQRLMAQMLMGCYTKFVATYETSFWREAGLSGELFRFTNDKESCCSSPVCAVFDGTTSNKNAALVGFFTGYGASYWAHRSVRVFFCIIGKMCLSLTNQQECFFSL